MLIFSGSKKWPERDKFREADWQTDEVLWRNRQWAVTTYGIESVSGPVHYDIPRSSLCATWLQHMEDKAWVDAKLFAECFVAALVIHGEHERPEVLQ